MRIALLFLGLVLAVSGCAGTRDENPKKILHNLVRAGSDSNFTGITRFERQQGGQFFRFRMKIAHKAPDLTRLEILEPESKKGVVIIKRGHNSWKIGGDSQEPVNFKQFGSHRNIDIRNADLLLKNYDVRLLGSEKVAGRDADMLEILPRTPRGVRRVIWADKKTGLLLKSEETISSAAGRYTKNFTYDEIEFPKKLPMELFQVQMPPGSRSALPDIRRETITLAEAVRTARFGVRVPRELPDGFILEHISWVSRTPTGFLHFQYSDGLMAISLFQEGALTFHPDAIAKLEKEAGDEEKIFQMNDGVITMLHRRCNGTHATLVGEIPPEELIRMISSLENSDGSSR